MRIVPAATPVASATSLIASFFMWLRQPTAQRRFRIAPYRERREAPEPPRGAADRQRGDRRPRGAHRHGPQRRGALDPGRERRDARGRTARALAAGQPGAARAHLL